MIALIPARGGSKGILKKNLQLLGGLPLIAHTILAAKASHGISRVVVSTDSSEIRDVALKYHAEVPFLRPAHLATDEALAIDVFRDAVHRLRIDDKGLAQICVLQPTSPLRKSSDIEGAINLFLAKQADAVISVCRAPVPINWYRQMDENLVLRPVSSESGTNRQVEKPLFVPNGAIYILRADFLLTSNSYYSSATYGFEMPSERSIDIDEPLDLRFAELVLQSRDSQV